MSQTDYKAIYKRGRRFMGKQKKQDLYDHLTEGLYAYCFQELSPLTKSKSPGDEDLIILLTDHLLAKGDWKKRKSVEHFLVKLGDTLMWCNCSTQFPWIISTLDNQDIPLDLRPCLLTALVQSDNNSQIYWDHCLNYLKLGGDPENLRTTWGWVISGESPYTWSKAKKRELAQRILDLNLVQKPKKQWADLNDEIRRNLTP